MESISPANDIKILLCMCNSRRWKVVSTSTEALRQIVKLPTCEELSVNCSVYDTSNPTASPNTQNISHKSLIYMERLRHVVHVTQEPTYMEKSWQSTHWIIEFSVAFNAHAHLMHETYIIYIYIYIYIYSTSFFARTVILMGTNTQSNQRSKYIKPILLHTDFYCLKWGFYTFRLNKPPSLRLPKTIVMHQTYTTRSKASFILHILVIRILIFWRRNYFFNFSTPCI